MVGLAAGLLAFAGWLGSAAAAAPPDPNVEARLQRLHAVAEESFGQPAWSRSAAIEREYTSDFGGGLSPRELARVSDASLPFYFEAAEIVGFYSQAPAYLDDLDDALRELERRALATDAQRAAYFRALVGLRRFDRARAYRAAHPALPVEPVPGVADIDDGPGPGRSTQAPVVYAVDAGGDTLLPRYADLGGTTLVVVSHPVVCAYSRRAMEAFESDPELRPLLGKVLWLAPVDQRLRLEQVGEWNRSHPETPLVLARHRSDWPALHDWATPHFYLIRDGQPVGDFAGWPEGGNKEKLMELLAGAGLPEAGDG